MTTDTGFQKFLTLTGPGGTGKSVVIGMMEDIMRLNDMEDADSLVVGMELVLPQ